MALNCHLTTSCPIGFENVPIVTLFSYIKKVAKSYERIHIKESDMELCSQINYKYLKSKWSKSYSRTYLKNNIKILHIWFTCNHIANILILGWKNVECFLNTVKAKSQFMGKSNVMNRS